MMTYPSQRVNAGDERQQEEKAATDSRAAELRDELSRLKKLLPAGAKK